MPEENTQVNTSPVEQTAQVDPQPVQATVEENTQADVPTENNTNTGAVDNLQVPEQPVQDAPNVDEDINTLKAQLEEYKLRDEEVRQLTERLGTNNIADPQIFEAQKQLNIIDNQAQQEYISLCNKFGVDYRPDKIEQSANELKARDPQAYYELQNRVEKLDLQVQQKRQEISNFVINREVNLALSKHQQALNASPMLKQQLNEYLKYSNLDAPMQQIDMFMNMAQAIQREAFEYGKIYAQQAEMQKQQQPQQILNNTVMANNQTYSGTAPKIFTRQEIANMSQAEFEKYEKEIDLAVKEGRIR